MNSDKCSTTLAHALIIALLMGVVALELARPVRAAGDVLSLQVDTQWIDGFFLQGRAAYDNGDIVTAFRLLYVYEVLSSRARTVPYPAFQQQLQTDLLAAQNVLYQGLNARNTLPNVQNDLQNCRAQPQCSGGGSGLNPGLTPKMPRTNLPPVPPPIR